MGIQKKYGEYSGRPAPGIARASAASPDAVIANTGRDMPQKNSSTSGTGSGYGKFYRKTKFRPKKPIRGFRDLEIYQRAQELVLLVKTNVVPLVRGNDDFPVAEMRSLVSGIPEKMAEAHSRRFEDKKKAIELLNDAKADCNRLTVYLDQVATLPTLPELLSHETSNATSAGTSGQSPDNVGSGTQELCWDLIKRLGTLRMKIYNLQKSWQKFWAEDKNKKL